MDHTTQGGMNAALQHASGHMSAGMAQGSGSMGAEMQQCIENCQNCHSSCLASVAYCLQMGGQHAQAAHIGLLLDCAASCQSSADFMLRGSEFHGPVCGVCAAVCERCAESCAQMGDDAQMQACAAACRRCAESCRRMAAMPA